MNLVWLQIELAVVKADLAVLFHGPEPLAFAVNGRGQLAFLDPSFQRLHSIHGKVRNLPSCVLGKSLAQLMTRIGSVDSGDRGHARRVSFREYGR